MMRLIKKNSFVLISLGAIPGALLRWHIDQIFIVNIIGCFLLGFFNSLAISKDYRLMLGFGLCGSMSTFSGWSYHLYGLFSQGQFKLFFFSSVLTVLIGFIAIGLGHIFGKALNL